LFEKLERHFGGNLRGKTFAVWGLAFKPNTDDIREAPSAMLIDRLLAAGARVRGYDPAAGPAARARYANDAAVTICDRRDDTCAGADGIVLMTEWNEFRSPDFGALKAMLREAAIFDGRNLYDPRYVATLGFAYYGIGRGLDDRGIA